MIQKKIKIPEKDKLLINRSSTSIEYKFKIPTINKEKTNIKTKNLKGDDFETNPIDCTITSDSTTATDTTKKIYVYRKNISKQKNILGTAKQNSKNKIKHRLFHCTSMDNLNKNKKNSNRFNTLETFDYKNNICKENTINNDFFQNYEKSENNIIDTTPNKKYYKHNNYTVNSGPNIFKKGINLNKNYFYNQSLYSTGIQKIIKKNEIINIEDLLLLEEKFNDIIFAISNKSNIANECFELINFYYQSSLYNKFENYFKDYLSKKIVHSSILLTIFDVILVYHISFDDSFFNIYNDFLSSIIKMNHQSYLLICDYISNKVSSSEKENIWVKKLRLVVNSNISHISTKNKSDFKNFILKKN